MSFLLCSPRTSNPSVSHTLLWNLFPFPYIDPSKHWLEAPRDGAEHKTLGTVCSESKTSEFPGLMSQKPWHAHVWGDTHPFPVHRVEMPELTLTVRRVGMG